MRGTWHSPHIASEQYVTSLSMEDCTLLVKLFYRNGNYAPVVLKKFCSLNDIYKKKNLQSDQPRI